jgi:hypothetical protein
MYAWVDANSGNTFGHSSHVPVGAPWLHGGVMIGHRTEARWLTIGEGPNTTGGAYSRAAFGQYRAKGDWVLSNKGEQGQPWGWVITADYDEDAGDSGGAEARALGLVPIFDNAVHLLEMNVADLPAAWGGNRAHMVYCLDGDNGSPCLAVSDGTAWRRIALGAAVSAS